MKIYHFLSSKYALENLEKRRVKISRLNNLNDPFELVSANHSDVEQRVIWNDWRKIQSEKLGLVCFSKTWKNPVMWSHYADRHKGICLGFEVPDKAANIVVYTKRRLNIDLIKLREGGRLTADLMRKVFVTKYIDWQYEKEVRLFANLEISEEGSGHYFHPFNNELKLTEILIGPLCNETESTIAAHIQPEDNLAKVLKTRVAYKTFDIVQHDSKY